VSFYSATSDTLSSSVLHFVLNSSFLLFRPLPVMWLLPFCRAQTRKKREGEWRQPREREADSEKNRKSRCKICFYLSFGSTQPTRLFFVPLSSMSWGHVIDRAFQFEAVCFPVNMLILLDDNGYRCHYFSGVSDLLSRSMLGSLTQWQAYLWNSTWNNCFA